MSFINNAQIKAAQRLHKARQEAQQRAHDGDKGEEDRAVITHMEHSSFSSSEIFDDFFSVIRQSKDEGISDADVSLIWGPQID